jgi:hypothetical protein
MSTIETIEELLRVLGLSDRIKRLSETVWTMQRRTVTIQIVAAPEFVVATAIVAPSVIGAQRESVYASLLRAQMQLLGAFFTLEADDSIRVNQIVPSPWLQDRELAFLIENVAVKAEEWKGKLSAASH